MKKQVNFILNGKSVSAEVAPHETLLDLLRNDFGLGGAKETCGLGLCGVCTIIVSGVPVSGCLHFASSIDGEEILTIEGMETEEGLHPVQEAFLNNKAFQCGYCTPGMILMAKKLLEENANPSVEEIKDYMAGNICRCASYGQIIEAINEASKLLQQEKAGLNA
ncbi:(2Fe-2S)-binding protein [Alteribacillus sp. YIM 98480]|uniref:(2Fe-2S)-binding protein n=1 Tax=Alteribacillus sp. YIM 98480 TaxID=2606599 RepID=UPI0018EEDD43|nr:(2Fe-2S)-binding protein [Alteribacillus sp. YIM 98480]